jgi:DNA-binding transcriptional LysR family regulator
MRAPAIPSNDQLLVLLAVVETGSFSAAAKHLGRATSAVTYAIDALERQLGLSLFDRGTTRRPKLTHEGEAIVSEARAVVFSIDTLRARAKGLIEGIESEVALAVDPMFPSDRLVAALGEFHTAFPAVPLRLISASLGAIERAIRDGDAGIGVGCTRHMNNEGLQRIEIGSVHILPVAAADHPLALAPAKARAREYLQLVLTDQREFEVLSVSAWRVTDFPTKHKLLLGGIGWGGMPEPMVRGDIEAGRLVPLDIDDWRGGEGPLQIVHRIDTPPGPAGRWIIDRLASAHPAMAHPALQIKRERSPA